MQDAFLLADDILRQGVRGICDIITLPGLINVDFADVRARFQFTQYLIVLLGVTSY